MDRRWRNLLVLLVVAVLAYAGYLFLPWLLVVEPPPPELVSDLAEFDSLFEESGVDSLDIGLDTVVIFDEGLGLVESASSSEVASLKNGLRGLQASLESDSQAKEIQKEAAGLYLEYLDFVEMKRAFYAEVASLGQKQCLDLPYYADLQLESDGLLIMAAELEGKEILFEESFDSEPIFLIDLEGEANLNQSLWIIYKDAFDNCEFAGLAG